MLIINVKVLKVGQSIVYCQYFLILYSWHNISFYTIINVIHMFQYHKRDIGTYDKLS